jgi:signal transduction histidine kinase
VPETAVSETTVPETTVTGGAWPQTAETEKGVKITDIKDMKTAETPPVAFAEVARRLWGAGMEIPEDPEFSEADAVSPAEPPTGRTEAGRETFKAVGLERGSQTRELAGPLQAVAEGPVPSAAATVAGGRALGATDAKAAESLVENAPALAHDACNLLSALGLYGELLAFPGVLGHEHRHYAEELKLLAARSEVLIGRLLRTAEPEESATARDAATAQDVTAQDVTAQDVREAGYEAEQSRVEAPVQPPFAAQAASPEAMGPGALTVDIAAPQPVSLRPGAAPASASAALQATNLVDLLMRWGSLLSTLAHGTLEVSFGPGAATPVPAAAEPLERILVNLVRNARAATAGGGAIRIGVGRRETAPEAVVLTVDDSGCGMDEAQVRSILAGETAASPRLEGERGGTGMPAVPAAGGRRRRGLGLQIVRELVAASGGTLSIQSRPGTGTRIEIRWPLAQPAAAPGAATGDQPESAGVRAGVAAGTAGAVAAGGPATELEAPPGLVSGRIPRPVAILSEGASPIRAAAQTQESAPQVLAARAQDAGAAPGRMPDPVGPDGFSEEQLRAMMLRLHRTAPGERIRAGAPWTSQVPSQGLAPGSVWGSARGGGLASGRPVPVVGGAASGVVAGGPGTEGVGADRDSGDDSALKGAIAC